MATFARSTIGVATRQFVSRSRSTRSGILPIPVRSFKSSSVALKKNRKPLEVEQDYPEEDGREAEEEEDDLFASFASTSTPLVRDPSAQLQPLLKQVDDLLSLPTEERKRAFSHTKVGVLRRIVQLYPAEEVDGLKGVLKQWRTLGGRVTRKTAEEVVDRLCHLNRSDLALDIVNDRTSYGLPALPTHVQTRLHHALLHSAQNPSPLPPLSPGIPVSPTLAILRLALRQRAEESPISQADLDRLLGQVKKVKVEVKEADEWRAGARGMLERAGGAWADAAKRIEAAAL